MTQSEQSNSPRIADAIRERTIGEKHAYLDGYKAGIRKMAEVYNLEARAILWLTTADDIRDSLPPR